MAKRLKGRYGYPADDPFKVTFHPERLQEPYRWKKPRRVFVCSMGDLFHRDVPDDWIKRVIDVMAETHRHTYQILTKRPERLNHYVWPDNAWLGASVENLATADERIPLLLNCPAKVHWVSIEPLLEDIMFSGQLAKAIERRWLDGVVVGGESGPGARPMNPDWVRSIRDYCVAVGVPFLFKQWGAWAPGDAYSLDSLDTPAVHAIFKVAINGGLDRAHPWFDDHPTWSYRVGKKYAGRLLDGRTWDGMPGE
jgi:protein gp37